MTTTNRLEVDDHASQSREFLRRSREYLAEDDLHQASEKAWGAAAHMVKAVAAANGWSYEKHADFSRILNNVWLQTRNDRIRELRGSPNELHGYYYLRKRFLNADIIAADIEDVAELVELLEPLTQ